MWLARDERLDRDVAVKVLDREQIVGGRFEREARAAARLSHPAIVTLYEAAVDDDGAYLVSELIRGATLAQLLEAGGLSDRDILRVGIAMCEGLAHAHSQGVVHRDVKPSNVLIPEHPAAPAQPAAKLTDFGVARLIGGDSLTRTGDVIGTAAYMAPEQAEGREVGAAADLYSLALVIYEALTGVNPIRSGTAAGRARRLGAYLPPLRRHRRDLPRELGRGVDLALRPRPRERGTVEDLRAALLLSLDDVDDSPGVVASPWPVLGGIGRRSESEPGAWADARSVEDDAAGVPGLHSTGIADAGPVPDSKPPAPGWPARALGGVAAGVLAGWFAADLLSPPISPAAAGLVAGLAVAALPRIGWLALALAAAGSLGGQGLSGAALVVLFAALVPVILLFWHPTRWPLAAAAPLLGLVGMAGAWPAMAARATTAWQRAALAITGWVWLELAGPLAGIGPYAPMPRGIPSRQLWMPSLYETTSYLLSTLLSSGVLAPALVWAAGAVVLPWITRSRVLEIQIVLVTMWSAGLAAATATILQITHAGGGVRTGTAVLGAVAAGLVALCPTLVARRRAARQAPDVRAGLA